MKIDNFEIYEFRVTRKVLMHKMLLAQDEKIVLWLALNTDGFLHITKKFLIQFHI